MKRLPRMLLSMAVSAGVLIGCGGGGDGGGGTGSPWLRSLRGQTAGGVGGTDERGEGIAADAAGNVYVTGPTTGTLPGSPTANQGNYDLFLVKYNSAGDNIWTRQLGSPDNDVASAVAVDAAGNAYVAGSTAGALPGSPMTNQGNDDLFLVKYNSAGDVAWTRQTGSPNADSASAVAVDTTGNAYVTGSTAGTLPGSPTTNQGKSDLFLVKYNPAGDNVWTRQLGSPDADAANAVAVDGAGNAYLAGSTTGTLPGSPAPNEGNDDLFLVKYNPAGDIVWTRQMGSESFDTATAVAVDTAGNVYVAGYTTGTLPGSPTANQGFADLFLVKYNSAGDNVWTRQLGSPGYDRSSGVSVDAAGNIYVAGTTGNVLPGSPVTNRGGIDLFVVKFNGSGERLWTQQKGSSGFDGANGIAVGKPGGVYVTGETDGSLDGRTKAGSDPDGFILKYLPDGTGP